MREKRSKKIEKRKIKKKKKEKNMKKKRKKIEEKGTLTLSLYQKRKKYKQLSYQAGSLHHLYHLDSAQSSSTLTRQFHLGDLLTSP